MYGPNICAKYQEQSGDDVKVILFTSGCPFADKPNGIYKVWAIPLALKTKPLPPLTLVGDSAPNIHYTGTWQSGTSYPIAQPDDQAKLHFTHTPGDAVEYSFTGTGIALLADKYQGEGGLNVFVDDQPRGRVDLQVGDFPRLSRVEVFTAQHLSPGQHKIRIVNAGSNYVTFDGFAVTTGANP